MSPSRILPPSLHILGSGSIGLLFASSIRCALPTYPVTVLLRSGRGHEDRITRKICPSGAEYSGITAQVKYPNDESSSFNVDVPAEIISPDPTGNAHETTTNIQNLLVATKAPDAAAAVSSVFHRLDKNCKSNIIILSNGAMGVRDEIEELLRGERCDVDDQRSQFGTRVTLASTTHGAYRFGNEGKAYNDEQRQYSIVHAGVGSTFVESQSMANLFDEAGLRATYASPDGMNILLWKKLATNCAINPLTALQNCVNGELANMDVETSATMDGIIKEVSQIARKDAANHGLSDDLIKELDYESLSSFVSNVIRDTASNKSSMLQDVLAERETEINYLNGYVARIGGEKFGHECPFNEEMVKRIEGLSALQ